MRFSIAAVGLVALAGCAAGPVTALVVGNGDIAACIDGRRAVPCPTQVASVQIHSVTAGPIAWQAGSGRVTCAAGGPTLAATAAPVVSAKSIALRDAQDQALRRLVWEAVAGQGPFKDREAGEEAQLNYAFAVDLNGDGRDETVFEIEEVEVVRLPEVGLIRSFDVVNGIIGADGGRAALFAKAAMHDPLAGLVPVGESGIGLVFANVESVTVVTFDGRRARALPGSGPARCAR